MATSAHRKYKKFPPGLKNKIREEADAIAFIRTPARN